MLLLFFPSLSCLLALALEHCASSFLWPRRIPTSRRGGGGMNVRHEKSYLQSSIIDSHTGKKTFERGEGLAEAK